MNEYKKIIRKLSKGQIIERIERKKRERYDLERTLPCLALNPQYDDGSNARTINRLTKEIELLFDVLNEK